MNDGMDAKRELLSMTLALAVPGWAERLRRLSWEQLIERAKVCSQHIAEHGDNLLFRSKKKGESADAFNHLAEGIACLSFASGGLKLWGNHWEHVLDSDGPNRFADQFKILLDSIHNSMAEAPTDPPTVTQPKRKIIKKKTKRNHK